MLLAPAEVPRFLRWWRHVFTLTLCPCSPQRSSFHIFIYKPGNGRTELFVFCASNSQTATTETRTDLRFVTCVTWSSPPPWWPSRTTRAKFTPRTWGWNPSRHRRHVCTSSQRLPSFLFVFFPQFPFSFFWCCWFPVAFQTPAAVQARKKPAEDPSSAPAGGGSGGGGEDGSDSNRFCSMCQASFNNPLMAQQHYVGKKHRKQMTKMKLMETYGPATAPGQNARPPRPRPLPTIPCADSLPVCVQPPRWRATPAPSARLSWTLWSSTSLTSVAPNTTTSRCPHTHAHTHVCFSHSDVFFCPFSLLKSKEVESERNRKPNPCRAITGQHQHGRPVCPWREPVHWHE